MCHKDGTNRFPLARYALHVPFPKIHRVKLARQFADHARRARSWRHTLVAATFYIVLPAVAVNLGLSHTETGLLVSILHVSSFAANFLSGPLTDITGRHILLQTCALLVGAAALAGFVVAPGFFALAALITIIGVTNNLWHPPAIFSTAFPPTEATRYRSMPWGPILATPSHRSYSCYVGDKPPF